MFPTTDNSLTIIETLMQSAEAAEVEIRTSEGVTAITPKGNHYVIESDLGNMLLVELGLQLELN